MKCRRWWRRNFPAASPRRLSGTGGCAAFSATTRRRLAGFMPCIRATDTFRLWSRHSGIGKEFARQIAASGIHVALVGRREPLLRTVGAECTQASGVQHRIIPLDLSEPDFLPVLADATRDLDVGLVVSNAGTGNPGKFLKLDRQLLQVTLRLNTMAHLDITHHFGAKLLPSGGGAA